MTWQETMKAVAEAQQGGKIRPKFSQEEVAERGQSFYNTQLKERLLPQHKGEHLVINVETMEYELAKDEMTACLRMLEKDPTCGPHLYHLKVGYKLTMRNVPAYREECE